MSLHLRQTFMGTCECRNVVTLSYISWSRPAERGQTDTRKDITSQLMVKFLFWRKVCYYDFVFVFFSIINCMLYSHSGVKGQHSGISSPSTKWIWRWYEVHSLVRKHLQPEPSNQAQIRMFLVVVAVTIMVVVVVMCVDKRSAAAVSFRIPPT